MSLTRRTLVLIALLSGLATALVVHAGLAGTAAQKDALAALRHPATVTAVQRGETLVAIAPPTVTTSPARNIAPPAGEASSAANAGGEPAPPAATAATVTTATATATTATTATNVGLPKVGHVFIVSLSTRSFSAAFGKTTSATYLRSLLKQGTLLSGYRSLGHGELADQIGLLSGQPPNRDTTAGCPRYVAFSASAVAAANGTVPGPGCVYPDTTLTLADQVTNSGKQWKAYVEGMGATACPTPQSDGAEDSAISTVDADYATIHNPFIFFPSLTGSGACYLDEGDTSQLGPVLAGTATATPALTYVAPSACADGALADAAGSDTSTTTAGTTTGTTSTGPTSTGPTTETTTTGTTTTGMTTTGMTTTGMTTTSAANATASTTATQPSATATITTTTSPAESATTAGRDDYCPPGQTSGITAEDQFLATWIPQILSSKAYKANGVLIIAFSGVTPKHGRRPYSTGALVISRWTPKNRRVSTAYQPYSLLRSIEDMLDLQPLANAAAAPAFAKRILRTP